MRGRVENKRPEKGGKIRTKTLNTEYTRFTFRMPPAKLTYGREKEIYHTRFSVPPLVSNVLNQLELTRI